MGSTSYISTRNGSISQHVEYIAFGEVLFEEHSSSFSSPYLFNGKELDRETNLSYYGARYLDMKTSLWLNVDPLALYNPIFEHEFYFDGQHNGGVYNSGNLAPYIYCYQNPVRFIDPNGKQTEVTNIGSIFNADKNSKIDPTVRGQNRVDEKSHIRVNASIYKNALSQKSEKNTTHIYSHGWYNKSKSGSFSYLSIYYEDQNKYYSIRNSNDLKSWLSSNGISSNFLNTKGQTLILHGCRSAYGENSVAQTLSKENPDLITVGATGNVAYNEKGEYVGTVSNGNKDKGKWNVYKNGEVINSFPWDWKPNNKDVQKGIKNEQ
ncbi:RHS repeat-associated protein [Flavobacterium sp. 7E]|uniref:RHS repeat domain-containing protein n=1 Tax=Flavobacterium sp. 7E TaxID=2735898 RepID=UPI0015711E56|nr:RHS repeat-associated core domain-containing protein [Flavobacterium sp. 7E]NRS90000.1 RHS repeat-associated protein [Flavobacterium sp. 7E]